MKKILYYELCKGEVSNYLRKEYGHKFIYNNSVFYLRKDPTYCNLWQATEGSSGLQVNHADTYKSTKQYIIANYDKIIARLSVEPYHTYQTEYQYLLSKQEADEKEVN